MRNALHRYAVQGMVYFFGVNVELGFQLLLILCDLLSAFLEAVDRLSSE